MNIPVLAGRCARLGAGADESRATLSSCAPRLDRILAVSACPQDIVPINDKNPTPVAIELL